MVARVLCSSQSSGWFLGCYAVVSEFCVVARVLCSFQRVLGGC